MTSHKVTHPEIIKTILMSIESLHRMGKVVRDTRSRKGERKVTVKKLGKKQTYLITSAGIEISDWA